jgi:hypothetical protein
MPSTAGSDLAQTRLVRRAVAVVGADRCAQRILVLAQHRAQRQQVLAALGQGRHRVGQVSLALQVQRGLELLRERQVGGLHAMTPRRKVTNRAAHALT